MEIKATEQDGISVLTLSGRMDATTTPEFESAARALLVQGKIKAASGKLAFCSLQPMAAEVFRISGFNAMLTVCGTREDALCALRG